MKIGLVRDKCCFAVFGAFAGRAVCSEECIDTSHIFNRNVIAHIHLNTHTLLLIQLIIQPMGSEPISSHQRILISSMAQLETTIIHLPCLNVNPTLASLRIHHVIRGFLQPVDELEIQYPHCYPLHSAGSSHTVID